MSSQNPAAGELWIVDIGSGSIGHEMQKVRPGIVLRFFEYSHMAVVIPLTSKLEKGMSYPYAYYIRASSTNGLNGDGLALIFQMKNLDVSRFRKKLGTLTADELDEVYFILSKFLEREDEE